jgi:hypothetical protein
VAAVVVETQTTKQRLDLVVELVGIERAKSLFRPQLTLAFRLVLVEYPALVAGAMSEQTDRPLPLQPLTYLWISLQRAAVVVETDRVELVEMVVLAEALENEQPLLAWETLRPQIPHRAIMDLQMLVILAAAEAVLVQHQLVELVVTVPTLLLLAP